MNASRCFNEWQREAFSLVESFAVLAAGLVNFGKVTDD